MVAEQDAVIRLEAVPVRRFLESQDHQHDLIRELQLIQIGERSDTTTAEISGRLARLISETLAEYEHVRAATRQQMTTAQERGAELAELEVPVVPGLGDALRRWLGLLEEADELCTHGELLLVAAPPEIRELRRWYVQEITSRLESLHADPPV